MIKFYHHMWLKFCDKSGSSQQCMASFHFSYQKQNSRTQDGTSMMADPDLPVHAHRVRQTPLILHWDTAPPKRTIFPLARDSKQGCRGMDLPENCVWTAERDRYKANIYQHMLKNIYLYLDLHKFTHT